MCGIIGYTGVLNAPDVLIEGLRALEYRGYDSSGIACFANNGQIVTIKKAGKVNDLAKILPKDFTSTCGIGHTRWATHGGVSDINSHPHTFGRVTLIHNGIIENYLSLKAEFESKGKVPVSQTDTEIAAMVIDDEYKGDAREAIVNAIARLKGSYSFCIMFNDEPGVIYCTRKNSPLVGCKCSDGSIIASDLVALLRYSKEYFVLEEGTIARLTENEISITDFSGKPSSPEMLTVTWDVTSAQKNGYTHYMQKEINEQPESIARTITPRVSRIKTSDGTLLIPDFTVDGIPDDLFSGCDRIIITACGTAMHAGMVGRMLFERFLRIPVTVEIASEFRYNNPIINHSTIVITVSQSGETADTLAALKLAGERGAKTLSIVNVKGSSIARASDFVLYTHAGPEIAVASTKAYTAQLTAFYLLAMRAAYTSKKISPKQCSDMMQSLLDSSDAITAVLDGKDKIKEISRRLSSCENMFFIGRGLDYALSCEASIKMKEITYIHSEAYAAGELKHGTLSLITSGVPVIAIATQKDVFDKMISNVKEVRSRGALVVLITGAGFEAEEDIYDFKIELPKTDDLFTAFPAACVLQTLAYYTSSLRGLDVDQPRNLAKSVTVE